MKTQQCDECKFCDMRPIGGMICEKGHKPRFYLPKSYTDSSWGYKRKCRDFKSGACKQRATR